MDEHKGQMVRCDLVGCKDEAVVGEGCNHVEWHMWHEDCGCSEDGNCNCCLPTADQIEEMLEYTKKNLDDVEL